MPTVEFLIGDAATIVEIDEKGSILEQALSRGLAINHSCMRGDCGQCVGSLLSGTVEPLDINRPSVRGNDVYVCNTRAVSNLIVRLPWSPETEHIRVLRSPCKIHELKLLSADVLSMSLKLPPGAAFKYVPGQFIRLTNKVHSTRSYSLAETSPDVGGLSIHVRRVEQGAFSRYLFSEAKLGDLLHLEGPLGRFVLPNAGSVKKTIFLATGTGIVPVHAILSSLLPAQRERCGELFLYWGNRHQEDAYFHSELTSLAERLDLKYFSIFSRTDDARLVGEPRHVQDLMAMHHPNLVDGRVFAAGNASMIDEARKRCLLLGLPDEYFHADPFTPS